MDLSVIIINFQSEKYLEKCIRSIQTFSNKLKFEIIVVNNDPKPLSKISSGENVEILNICENVGFSKACNAGAKIAKGKILFFLNPDTELLDNGLLSKISLLKKDGVGIIAPTLLLPNQQKQPWSYGDKITPLSIIKNNLFFKKDRRNNSYDVSCDWISGAAFLVKKETFDAVGGFDEDFFMYFEDVDLCLRIKKLGKKIIVLSNTFILHFGGQSFTNDSKQKELYYASQDHYLNKNFDGFSSSSIRMIRDAALSLKNDILFSLMLAFCLFLPLQFALNPAVGIDLAIVRIILPLLFIALSLKIYKKRDFSLLKNWTTYLVMIFLFLNVFSLFFTHNLNWSLRKLAFVFSIFPIYFIARYVFSSDKRRRNAVVAMVIGATTVATIALIQFFAQFSFGIDRVYDFLGNTIMPVFLGNSFSKEVAAYPSWLVNSGGTTYMRAFAPFPDPHMLSYYMGLLLPWSIALWATSKSHRAFFLLTSAILAICDIATFTRGGYIALISAAIIVLPFLSFKNALKLSVATLIILAMFFSVPKNPVAGRIVSTFDTQEGSNQGRIATWKESIPVIAANPFGVGIGSYPLMIDPAATYRTPIYAHDVYLDIAAELGIPATLLFILLLWSVFLNYRNKSKTDIFFLGGVASITVFSVHSLVENPLYSVHVLPIFLIILALSSKNKE